METGEERGKGEGEREEGGRGEEGVGGEGRMKKENKEGC